MLYTSGQMVSLTRSTFRISYELTTGRVEGKQSLVNTSCAHRFEGFSEKKAIFGHGPAINSDLG